MKNLLQKMFDAMDNVFGDMGYFLESISGIGVALIFVLAATCGVLLAFEATGGTLSSGDLRAMSIMLTMSIGGIPCLLAAVYCIVSVFINRYLRIVYQEDFYDVAFPIASAGTFYGTGLIFIGWLFMYFCLQVPYVGTIVVLLAGAELLARIGGKVRKLTKELKRHEEDKNAHR